MQNLDYLNYGELQFFAKLQGLCLFIATILLIVSHFYIDTNASPISQIIFIALFTIFLVVYAASLLLGERSQPVFTKFSIAFYSTISIIMLLVFLL